MIDSEGTLKPTCPHCGFDGFTNYLRWTYEGAKECPSCHNAFEYRTDLVYSTYKKISGGTNPDLGLCATCEKYDTCNQKTDLMIGCNMYLQTKKIVKRSPQNIEEETQEYSKAVGDLYDDILKDINEAKIAVGINPWSEPEDPNHNI